MAGNAKSRGNGASSPESQKHEAIALAVSTIEKQFGKGAILKMGDDGVNREVEVFSSGAPSSRKKPAADVEAAINAEVRLTAACSNLELLRATPPSP